jgi:N-formylglutamate amidohydrolase
LGPDPDPERLSDMPVAVHSPDYLKAPIVVASPHSGRAYPSDFVAASRLTPTTLRHSEDAHVDSLFADALDLGLPMVRALFPRAMVDANREPLELDPAMFSDRLPAHAVTHSPRIAAGLGTIPRVVTNGEPIFDKRLRFADVGGRIEAFRTPYHRTLSALISETLRTFGCAFVIDAHSMPSMPGGPSGKTGQADVVLGDGHGATCHPLLVETAHTAFVERGLSVARNAPYAGGFTTRHYGRPAAGVHVLQVEINRALYLDEAAVVPTAGFDALRDRIGWVLSDLIRAVDPLMLRADQAAE